MGINFNVYKNEGIPNYNYVIGTVAIFREFFNHPKDKRYKNL